MRGHKWELTPRSAFNIILPAPDCGFKVHQRAVIAKEYLKTLKSSNGSKTFMITGSLKLKFTNLSTGKTVTINTSGPGKIFVHPDCSASEAVEGHSVLYLTPPDPAALWTAWHQCDSVVRESSATDGTITSLSLKGHVLVNVCAALS